jgi:hypothetical protein
LIRSSRTIEITHLLVILVLDRDLKEFLLPSFSGSILPHLSLSRKFPEL